MVPEFKKMKAHKAHIPWPSDKKGWEKSSHSSLFYFLYSKNQHGNENEFFSIIHIFRTSFYIILTQSTLPGMAANYT